MAIPRFAWGIDIGNRALKAVKLVPGAGGLAIDDFDVVEHETVLSEAGDNHDTLIQTALATFVSRHPGIEKGVVAVGVGARQAFAKFVPLPPVEKKKIPEIVRFEAMQQIPFPLDDVEWSYTLFEDPASPDVEVGIFAMKRDLVNQQIKFFTDAKLNVQVVQMNPLAVYNAMYYDTRIKGTTMIVDLGAESTDLVIAEAETVWMRTIPIGGNNFTEALTKAFKVNFEKAEDLKRNASTSKYGRQIMQAMRPIFADLVSEIQRSIGFYSSVHKESRVSRVMALGSTFRLPGLQKYLEQNLTMPVEKLDRLGSGAIEDPKVAATFSENILSAAGAYGLALQAMGQGKIGASLLPESIRMEKMWQEKTKWFGAAAALFVVGTAAAYGKYYFDNTIAHNDEHTAMVSNIDRVENAARSADSKWSEIESAGAQDRQRLLNVMALPAFRDIWPQLNKAMFDALPQNQPGQETLASGKVEEIKKTPRAQRNQIFVDDMTSRYSADVTPWMGTADLAAVADQAVSAIPSGNSSTGTVSEGQALPTPGGASGVGTMGQPNPGTPVVTHRGFVLTLRVTTPNARADELIQKFVDTLKAMPPTADRPFAFDNVKWVKITQIGQDPTRVRELEALYKLRQRDLTNPMSGEGGGYPGGQGGYTPSPGGGVGSAGGVGGSGGIGSGYDPNAYRKGGAGMASAAPRITPPVGGGPISPSGGMGKEVVPPEAYFEPATKEDVRGDTEAIIVAVVVLDPPPKSPTPGGPGAPAATGNKVAIAP